MLPFKRENVQLTLISIARIRRFGITGLKPDDYIVAHGMVWYTILCVAFNKVASGGGSNLMTAEDLAALTPEITADRISGSKWVLVSEQSMILTIWSMKACMLLLYAGITYVVVRFCFGTRLM